jgi:hypothetical protein
LGSGASSPAVGAVVHVLLVGAVRDPLRAAVPQSRSNGSVALAGTVYGLLLYVVNFLVLTPVLTPLAFMTFRMAQPAVRGLAHLAFGSLPWFAFFGSGARRSDPILAPGHRSAGALS